MKFGISNSGFKRLAQEVEEPESLEELQERLIDTYGVELNLMSNPEGFILSKILVPEESRGGGIGSQVMEEVTAYADNNGFNIGLTPDDTWGGNVNKLKQFYKDFGFVPNKGRNKSYSFMESLVRYAQ